VSEHGLAPLRAGVRCLLSVKPNGRAVQRVTVIEHDVACALFHKRWDRERKIRVRADGSDGERRVARELLRPIVAHLTNVPVRHTGEEASRHA